MKYRAVDSNSRSTKVSETENNSLVLSPGSTLLEKPSQEIPRLLLNLKVHYRVHESLPLIPILSHTNLVHILISHSLKIHVNIILTLMSRSSKCTLHVFPQMLCIFSSPSWMLLRGASKYWKTHIWLCFGGQILESNVHFITIITTKLHGAETMMRS
jgi:hypothetical protein